MFRRWRMASDNPFLARITYTLRQTHIGARLEQTQGSLNSPVGSEDDIGLATTDLLIRSSAHHDCVSCHGNETINVGAQVAVDRKIKEIRD